MWPTHKSKTCNFTGLCRRVYCTNVWGQQVHRLTQKLPYLDVCGEVFFLFGFQMLETIVFKIQIYTQKHSNIRKTISFKVYNRTNVFLQQDERLLHWRKNHTVSFSKPWGGPTWEIRQNNAPFTEISIYETLS